MAQRGRNAAAGARHAARSAAPPEPSTLRPQELAALRDRIRRLVEPLVEAENLDLDDLTVARAGRRYVVRITVDGDDGIGHNELSDVSRAISTGLDEAEQTTGALPEAYTLEVSSPGVDRPLTLARHWRRNAGRLVKVTVHDVAGDRQVTGRILDATDDMVTLDVDGQQRELALADLGPGRVQVEFNRLAGLTDDDLGELTDEGDGDDGDETDDTGDSDQELEDEA